MTSSTPTGLEVAAKIPKPTGTVPPSPPWPPYGPALYQISIRTAWLLAHRVARADIDLVMEFAS
jgi:hypothetical protein